MSDSADPPRELKSETLNLLLELARNIPSDQLKASDAVDSKIFQAFAAGSILVGLAAAGDVDRGSLTTIFVSVAVASFLVLAITASWALWSRSYRVPMSSRQLWEEYWNLDPDDVRHAYLHDLATGYSENETHIATKHRALRWVLAALVFEAAAIGAALIASVA